MPRILFATIGSLGDLHPVIALALALRDRGHRVAIATSENYRGKLGALGIPFHPLRPDLLAKGEHVIADIMDGTGGTERLLRDRIFPAVRDMHADLAPLAADADLLITSELVFAAPLLAETLNLPWISFSFAPVSLFSTADPSELPVPPALAWINQLGPGVYRSAVRLGKFMTRTWWRPVRNLRLELGLTAGENPLFEGKFSPRRHLALFSSVLQPPQADWPPSVEQTGFCFFDELASPLPGHVADFLAAGEPPIVFTLGSAAVYIARDFYEQSARAAQLLGRRAVLLLGQNRPPENLPSSILACDYLPFARIFPRAAAIVHQGGVGTTAQAMRSGRPMLIVPFAHDQFDNAARANRLGVARRIHRRRYTAATAARELRTLLADASLATTAAAVGARLRAERGVDVACDAIERAL